MLEFGNKEFRNLQEQVEKNKEDIKLLLSGGLKISYWVNTTADLSPLMTEANVGKFVVVGTNTLYLITKRANEGLIAIPLGVYPASVQGERGQQGLKGNDGKQGAGVRGISQYLPSPVGYDEDEIWILFNGNVYKIVSGKWNLQMNIKGPQGPVGPQGGTEVVANPVSQSTSNLGKVKIDGTTYNVLDADERAMLADLIEYVTIDHQTGNTTFGADVEIDGDLQVNSGVAIGGNLTVETEATFNDDVDINGSLHIVNDGLKISEPNNLYFTANENSLQDELDSKEDEGNKVVVLSSSSTDTEYPSAKVVYDSLAALRLVAEGKTKSYVINTQSEITGTKGSDDQYTNVTAITGVTLANLKIGDVILIKEIDVPDYWVSQITPSVSLNKMETSKVDISGYVTLATGQTISGSKVFSAATTQFSNDIDVGGDASVAGDLEVTGDVEANNLVYNTGDQTISGVKTFENEIRFGSSNFGLKQHDANLWSLQKGTTNIMYGNTNNTFFTTSLETSYNKDIGSSSNKWKDLYLSGTVYSDFIKGSSTNNIYIGADYNVVYINSYLRPYRNNAYDLGSSSVVWKNLYLGTSLKIGNTTLNEQQLIALLALLG